MRLKRNVENWLWVVPLVLLVVATGPPTTSFSSERADAAWDAAGLLLIVLGAALRTCARGWKHEQGSEQLLTTGPYSRLRHPLYLGTFACGSGCCMIHGSLLVSAGFTLSSVLWYGLVIRREERRLAARWPNAHREYRDRVPMLIPRLKDVFGLWSSWPSRIGESLVREADALFIWPMVGLIIRIYEVLDRKPASQQAHVETLVLVGFLATLGATWLFVKHGRLWVLMGKRGKSISFGRIFFRLRNPLAGLPLVYALFSTTWEWEQDPLVWTLAILLVASGIAIRAWATCHRKDSAGEKKRLAVSGPDAYVRNRLYIGNIMLILGGVVASELAWLVPVALAWAVLVYSVAAGYEKQRLLAKVGDEYRMYRDSIPAFFPPVERSGDRYRSFVRAIVRQAGNVIWLVPFLFKELHLFGLGSGQ